MENEQLHNQRHTLAHLLAAVVLEMYPHAKPTIGPVVDDGFYYDFDFSAGNAPTESDLKKIQTRMRKMLPTWDGFSMEEISTKDAKKKFEGNEYKEELIDDIAKEGEKITLYTFGKFTDLCRGGHSDNPAKEIDGKSFKLARISGAYWRGDENKQMLTRIYGYAFETPEKLQEHLDMLEEAKKRDHRKLGKELDLFTFSDLIGSGLPLWTPKGTLLRDLVTKRINTIQKNYGYEGVTIPHITKKDLYETSGHWEKFGDELFKVKGKQDTEFVMKPMNCPHHTQIFASQARSYKDLPLRYTETTMVYRDEQAGELLGLSRVRSITQDDGHAFCRIDQIEKEIQTIVSVIRTFYTGLNMFGENDFWVSVSTRDEETALGDPKNWDLAEEKLEAIAKKEGFDYTVVPGEAAFYGPKIDFMFKDAIGREWQLATVQLDFIMPERFKLEFTNDKGEKETPVMIHRAIAGSLERFLSVMIEHFAGAFPVWLSPVQVHILPVADVHQEYAEKVLTQFKENGIRAEISEATDSLGKRIRLGKTQKIPYLLVVGDEEVKACTVSIESRDNGKLDAESIEKFTERIKEEVSL